MNCRQWVVDVIPCRRPHAERLFLVSSFQFSISAHCRNLAPHVREMVDRQMAQDPENQTYNSMFFGDCAGQINRGQQNENICLQERHTDMKPQKYDGNADWNQ
jgi:hypothetical protein